MNSEWTHEISVSLSFIVFTGTPCMKIFFFLFFTLSSLFRCCRPFLNISNIFRFGQMNQSRFYIVQGGCWLGNNINILMTVRVGLIDSNVNTFLKSSMKLCEIQRRGKKLLFLFMGKGQLWYCDVGLCPNIS